MIKLIITGRPYTKKTSQEIAINRRTGSRFVRQSKEYRKYEEDALWQLKIAVIKLRRDEIIAHQLSLPIFSEPVNVKVLYYLPDRKHVDLLGLEQATGDILQKAEIIEDDELIQSWDGSRIVAGGRYGGPPDKEKPRVEIEIEEIQAPGAEG